ncbi:ATP-binding cassette sub-family A member 17-like [Loxodonta africana]|uniref:ATP-binding cassette sub-family A member 17-like n=1 Tax=Loxodonta africana TaxID=9785 RepID=UPI0030D21A5B
MWHHGKDAMTKMFANVSVLVKRFPHGPYIQDHFFLVLQNEFPPLLMLSFICIELTIINSIVLEKERKLKVTPAPLVGGLSWGRKVWRLLMRNAQSGKQGQAGLCCRSSYIICESLFVSPSELVAQVATATGGVTFFFTYLPYLYITFSYTQRSHLQKIACCLFSNVAMALGIRFISLSEAKGVGLQWRNIGGINGDFNFAQVLLMLLFDSFLYGLVAWYLESAFPGANGIPKPWYFFVMPSYWQGKPIPPTHSMLQIKDSKEALKGVFIQEEPIGLMKGIEIQHLYKVFHKGRNKNIAVKDLTMNLYRGQITVLLGHNGAGKTTTCSMLTGLLPISSGRVYINGYEISEDLVQVQKSLGWCPQHDILFYDLTVSEHLYFYARLKGLSLQKCREEVQEMLHTLDLEDKQDSPSKFLSGGMRRKLSIGIALIAGSEVLMLDEPTSGMDAISRRAIWDLLQQQKSDRTILLTTHFMDEADLLGDRIAIMAKGELQCCGSSLFLKQKYGSGYYMTLVRKPRCDTEEIAHLIYHHVPNAVLEASMGEELTFILPKDSTHRFESLFSDLERRQEELGISSFGASVTTMEEVFIRFYLFCQQFYAMFLKRMTYSWRNWTMMLSVQILVPLVIVIFSLMSFNLKASSMENVPLKLTLKTHGQTIVPFFISQNSSLSSRLSKHFTDMLEAELQIPLEVSGPVEEFLLQKAEEEPEGFDNRYVVAASIEDVKGRTVVTALFNNEAYHSPALAVALVDNFLFKLLSGAKASITATNHPQPQTAIETSEDILYQGLKVHYLVINLLFGMAFLSSSFSILTVKENSSKAKHVQFVSGVHVVTFWLSALLWDLISFLVPSLLLLVVFLYYKEEAFTCNGNILAVFLMLMLYGWAIIPFIYLASFCFTNTCNAFVKLIIMLTFLSIGPFILVSVTSEKDLGYTTVSESLDDTFIVFPGHCLGMAFSNLYYNFGFRKFCNAKKLNKTDCIQAAEGYVVQENVYAWESLGMGRYVTALAISGSVYIILLFLIETNTLRRLRARVSGFFRKQNLEAIHSLALVPEDQNVTEERKAVQSHLENLHEKNPLVVKEMSKVYFTEMPLLAVDKVSFTVQVAECFGLLGINGAGKTSIFKMLTGEELITSGDAFIQGFSINSDLRKVGAAGGWKKGAPGHTGGAAFLSDQLPAWLSDPQVWQYIGYCPQLDALLDHMTAQETLVMYARLRGIPECYIRACVDHMLDELLMYKSANKLVHTYSGGNKRKLNAIAALIGDPAVIFLDEPSSGMDPMARRLLWDTVVRARESGKAIIFTSHSMEECEALCTRLAIMVQGQFKCLGSPQHLKSKFGSGYSLRAKVQVDAQKVVLEEFKAFMHLTFPGSILEDEHQGMVHYHLPSHGLSWAKVFGTLEQAKEIYALDDYAVSQVSLEDIFLSFASPAPPSQGADV